MAKSKALDLRDAIKTIVVGMLDRERPKPRVGQVVSVDRDARRAEIIFAGETEPGIAAAFPPHLQPRGAGDVVLIEGTRNNYRITQILGRQSISDVSNTLGAYSYGEMLQEPTLVSNVSDGEDIVYEHGRFFAGTKSLPPVDSTVYVGYWENLASVDTDGSFSVQLLVKLLPLGTVQKVYNLVVTPTDTAGAWQNLFADKSTGVNRGNNFTVEIRSDAIGFELRIRNIRQHSTATAPSGYSWSMWVFGRDVRQNFTNDFGIEATARPSNGFRTTVATSEVDASVHQGPYFSAEKHILEVRSAVVLTGGSGIVWTGQNLKWSSQFMAHVGSNTLCPGGSFAIPMPAGGVVVTVHGVSGQSSTTVSSTSGINMRPGGSITYSVLYWEPTLVSETGTPGTWHLVGTTSSFTVPSHWIMIATMDLRGIGVISLKLGTGELIDHWRALVLINSWVNYGRGFGGAGYRMEAGRRVHLRGLIEGGAVGTALANMPAGYRPGELWMTWGLIQNKATGPASAGTAHTHNTVHQMIRLDIQTGGDVFINDTTYSPNNGFISLTGVSFPADN